MSSPDGPFANSISETAQATPVARNLSVAVLGPSVGDSGSNPGGQKRKQIRDALCADGHRPFFPEERVKSNPLGPSLLEQERVLLDSPDVDLVIILHTATSAGVLQEIAHFASFPEIMAKTAVLYPGEFYRPGENLPSDTISRYLVRMLYSERHFQVCSLVLECRSWANTMAVGRWVAFESHRF